MDKKIERVLEMRNDYRQLISTAGEPDWVETLSAIVIPTSTEYDMPARLYVPAQKENTLKPAILFIHGGGWVSGDLDTHDVLCRALANKFGAVVLAIDYRLAPEFPAPIGIEDSYAALQWLHQQAETLKINRNAIAVTGDSAGATIAIVVNTLTRDRKGPPICAQWLMYPSASFDFDTPSFAVFGETNFPTTDIMKFVASCYLPEGMAINDPLVSPLYGNHHHLSPTLISVGDNDPLYDGCIQLGDVLNHAGVTTLVNVYKNAEHGFIQFFKDTTTHPAGMAGLKDGVTFLKHYLRP
ncbi:Lipase 2 [Serratia proteamaculans]|uniref:Alpha/beta hydrolase n=1 Tax=Serratia proteamaculans TaxID=28151 RepID=A0ABS0TM40_SERPR|nr:alpha/beta hydrolase [Serratia proteamaculans]MBI6179172.1 alpha/beta hydrolase [Serratia proteamaculans]CAI0941698.1 Lipase 2 [Serratia proteamaculans]CAI2099179.1 Lipase 2 [Serratia proteamaculans]CAI2456293.1 Lipase 2 [Serratia proteamaculans]